MNKINWKPQGFMALMSVLIISALSLLIVSSLNLTFVWESRIISEQNNNLNAYYLAHSCAEEGLLRVRRDIDFSSGSIVIDTNNQCNVTIDHLAWTFTLTATGQSYEASQKVQVIFTISTEHNLRDEFNVVHTRNNIEMISWEKI